MAEVRRPTDGATSSTGRGIDVMAKVNDRRGWREQYDRTKRWQARLHKSKTIDERRRDDFCAFFVSCYHLKDWKRSLPRRGEL